MLRRLGVALALAILVGCKGADGATGPAGPAGPQGLSGPTGPAGTPHIFTGVIGSTGSASVSFPAAAGTDPTAPPSTTCFVAQTPSSGVWLEVSMTTASTGTCGVVFASGHWSGNFIQGPVGWTVAFVVVY